ncbi:ribose-5-phosphate isomerase RpiA [Anatilimnocola floriformis]|uniref:ribose-5-phosphate isomerase RpiA n=1 Tax=Anatilimnocola floriformis TaxID=2948575 RepID=UPI0020C59EEA|nr:ribose-5-phosphate isomerase RpiA [Anatilimnocola floriformis]
MPDLAAEKAMAAEHAVAEIQDGMIVGLGTGSTTAFAIRALGVRVAAGLQIVATATSIATERLARSLAIPLRPFDELSKADLTIDGADEITPALQAIKGGGGALLREKIVAAASTRTIIIADSSKLVSTLGLGFRLPLEVLPFATAFVERSLTELGFAVTQRRQADGTPAMTDQQNYPFDVTVGAIPDPAALAARLAAIPGVLEHGLFLSEIDELFIARGGQVEVILRGPNHPQ